MCINYFLDKTNFKLKRKSYRIIKKRIGIMIDHTDEYFNVLHKSRSVDMNSRKKLQIVEKTFIIHDFAYVKQCDH